MLKIKVTFFLILAFWIINTGVLFAENDPYQSTQPKKRLFTREVVVAVLESMDNRIMKGDDNGNKISYVFYRTYANKIKGWFKNPWMELDSRVAKSWYIDLYNTFVRMAKIKRSLERMELQHKDKTDVYKFQRKKFMAEYKHFKELQAKPTKLTKTRYRELVKAKRAWEKQERIKAAKARALARAKKHRKR